MIENLALELGRLSKALLDIANEVDKTVEQLGIEIHNEPASDKKAQILAGLSHEQILLVRDIIRQFKKVPIDE
ncbi:MAG: hypothetical protein K6T29_08150 [Peptococcaceae bacterium]|nr:hypothetical protein [Peptococcaceae bacterium]